ncbi:MAG: DHH family phosphoesterase, partial [Candidatus Sungbacteria bacterium]|nr:DHH family phosphoesterase [Candidatus Sungbacteria bacterium]
MKYEWILTDASPAGSLESQYPLAVSRLLVERGLDTAEKIDRFFKPEYERDLYDPFLLKDMRLACERIHKAVLGQEKIIIYSDYDVDGVSAATVLSEYFRGINYPFEIYLPDRQKEGHGVNQNTLEQLIAAGANLIVTLDCGTTNSKEVQWAKDRGVDMIVVDHHKVIVGRPAAAAFINPHQIGDNYPFKDLCGTGLAFKLYQGLKKGSEKKGEEKWLLDLVALATVADMVPMLDENRVFVKYGLFVLAKTKRVGLQMLMESS